MQAGRAFCLFHGIDLVSSGSSGSWPARDRGLSNRTVSGLPVCPYTCISFKTFFMKRFNYYFFAILIVAAVSTMFACCSTVRNLKCEHTSAIPVTYIGLDSVARTVYVPWCDTLRQLPPKPKMKNLNDEDIDGAHIDTDILPAPDIEATFKLNYQSDTDFSDLSIKPKRNLFYYADSRLRYTGSQYIPQSSLGAWWFEYARKDPHKMIRSEN
jgi:hypothetical protein